MNARAPRVLLVYANPLVTATPVAPLGMERVAQAFRLAGCAVRLCSPFLEADPLGELEAQLAQGWDLCGFSVRNLDDALVVRGPGGEPGGIDTLDLVPLVRPLVARAVEVLGPARVLVGGAAVGAAPEGVVAALGAAWGLAGPAEDLAWRLGRALARGEGPVLEPDPRVVQLGEVGPLPAPPPSSGPPHAPVPRGRGHADAWRPAPGPTPRHGGWLSLVQARGGRVAVQVAAGCDRRCLFCVEARLLGGRVRPRPVDEVLAEIEGLVALGHRRFWLATSELNVPDERHALALLRPLAGRGLDLAVFLQPAPVSEALLDALEAAGVDPSALSFELGHLDEDLLRAGAGPANLRQVEALVETFLRRGYRGLGGSVLFGAHPRETGASVDRALARARAFDAAFPEGLGLSYACGARVYPNSPLADRIAADRAAFAGDLYGADDPTFRAPVVFCRPGSPRALLQRVREGLAGCRGRMGPMNAEAPADPAALAAEALVQRGLWRLAQDRVDEGIACLEAALEQAPAHLEALARLGEARANLRGDVEGARAAFLGLWAALPPGDPRRGEVEAALAALGGPSAPRQRTLSTT